MLKKEIKELLHEGTVIPAHPLALNANRELDEERQRLLTRYYIASGAGGVAVGVHSTQFEIRDKDIDLFEPVLRLGSEEVDNASLDRPFVKVAGIVGPTRQAIGEAELASSLGYDMGLLSMGGLSEYSELELIKRAEKVGEKIPLFGFYLQPAVGGQVLSYDFWRDFAEIPTVHAIKMAPFNRYQTLDVVRAVCASSRYKDIALYTGNDDNIIPDLLTTYRFKVNGKYREKSIVGGLLGHWAVWTRKAVELLEEIKEKRDHEGADLTELLTRGIEVTDTNAVIFDAEHDFHGCIPGIHEILRRQGLLEGRWCLNPDETLSEGQMEEIDRVYESYPHLNDDEFVEDFLSGR
ncbi:Dihydrodipicolinate synthase/N-acetylneuraminate lyase [Fodinibius roseus]|uniref:Dihydrodipicolinate synthase/N-acetylneuraminate lyase n=1 Tax=Fodinibius roseus TaxID=1194090 RepID=A0A1M5IPX2_9BACT|nr:dihydrodipicolinate synthase family protein [Fodinibius roseus]SHG30404.1 Dihydrodipicolinate synthase/N-acetylneuraminate lyase [Fodinibius roseus]